MKNMQDLYTEHYETISTYHAEYIYIYIHEMEEFMNEFIR